jgi:hypothetical protein
MVVGRDAEIMHEQPVPTLLPYLEAHSTIGYRLCQMAPELVGEPPDKPCEWASEGGLHHQDPQA